MINNISWKPVLEGPVTQDNFENWTIYPEIKLLCMGGNMYPSPFMKKHFLFNRHVIL